MSFTLTRLSDDLIYIFEPAIRTDGTEGFRRVDGDYWIIWDQAWGWIAWDFVTKEIQGRFWDVLPTKQDPNQPPEGIWVSRKGAKSYVYQLEYFDHPV